MAATSWDPMQPILQENFGQIPEINHHAGIEEASQSWKAGAVIRYVSGSTNEMEALGSAGAYTAAAVAGIAQEDASGVTSATVVCSPIKAGQTYRLYCVNNGTAALSSTFKQGQNYGLYITANLVAAADANVTDQDMVTFVEPIYDVNGDATYYGKFKFLASLLTEHVGY